MVAQDPLQTDIDLIMLLAAKEQRAARQKYWLTHYQQPIISLTLVTPGQVKDSLRYRNTMGVALQMCDQLLWKNGWPVLDRQVQWLATGPEAMWCVAHQATAIKAGCSALEQTHPLGRLWDLDVICPRSGPIGRAALNTPLRPCLICEQPAHFCSRSRSHPLQQIIAQVDKIINDWFTRD